MIRHMPRARSGITLTEILISILIMGVGIVSLATLFPIGMVRLQKAQRLTRGAFLVESAVADLGTRNLLAQNSFRANAIVASWFTTASGWYDPWLQDTPAYGLDYLGPPPGVSRPIGQGLPVAYDPLWRTVTGIYPIAGAPEARFGQGVGFAGGGYVRDDPNPNGGPTTASAHGLQRISNLPLAYAATALRTFVSPEDIVLQDSTGQYADPNNLANPLINPSPIVPDMTQVFAGTAIEPTLDWRYTWFFTGQQADVSNATVFDGDIVVCENRQFGIDPATSPLPPGGAVYQTAGETVVEAVWGYSAIPDPKAMVTANLGYASLSARRTVLLRWPATMPDPDVRVGGWIADVTYERNTAVVAPAGGNRFPSIYPAQRCYWYQIAKRTDPTDDPVVGYRQMTVWVTTPLRAMSLLSFPGGVPYHVEAALIMPCVVNVYPRTVYTR